MCCYYKMAPSQAVCMSGLAPDADNEKENAHITVQGRLDNVHPTENSCLSSLEILKSGDDGKDNANYIEVSTPRIVERMFANGDLYAGSWRWNLPDGKGKYLWSDCCMYEGEWGKGKKTGRGK
eukprot:c28586_g4_i2 orf=1795-2163(+)